MGIKLVETTSLEKSNNLLLEAAAKLKDPDVVKAYMLDPTHRNADPISPFFIPWNDLSLAGGYPGLLLLFSTMQNQGLIEEEIAHRYVLKIKEAIETEGLYHLSLFNGVSGICFALHQASNQGLRYQKMLQALHNVLLEKTEEFYLAPIKEAKDQAKPIPSYLYDVIQGVSSVGRYILEQLAVPGFYELAQDIASSLVLISKPSLIGGIEVPGWHLSPEDILNTYNQVGEKGNFNLGLAHGIPGILAYLSISMLRGVFVEGQEEAIRRIALWVKEKSFIEKETIQWPNWVSFEEEVGKIQKKETSRDAWCYGTPGISRALLLAGKALKDENLISFAKTAFRDVFRRTRQEWRIPGPMLCHGISGLLMITREMSLEEGCRDLSEEVKKLEQILLSFYRSESPFGFNDVEPCKKGGYTEVSKTGFLEGSAGALLTLLTLSTPKPQWHLPLMIHV